MKQAFDGLGAAKFYLDPHLRRAPSEGRPVGARHGAARRSHAPPMEDARRGDPLLEERRAETEEAAPLDGQFLRKTRMLNMTALEAGQCAESRCDDAGVRGLAVQMVVVLGRIDTECRQLAERHAVAVAEQLDREHRGQVAALQQLGGAAFEQTYLRKFAMEAQLELIRLCGAQLTCGSDEGLRAAAGRWLQELRDALIMSRQVYFAA
jgi:predicted outer membrane protein